MAFIQQQRRPISRPIAEESSDNDQPNQLFTDSENDWHVISSTLPSATSPISAGSSPYSFTHNPSDTESFSDLDTNAFLPSHDGTGTFLIEDSSDQTSSNSPSESEESATEFVQAIQGLLPDRLADEIDSDDEVVDITLPHAGIKPPSFAKANIESPHFLPTAAGINSQDLLRGVSSGEVAMVSSEEEDSNCATNKSLTKGLEDLDRIPVHHPGIPGMDRSNAILSVVWNSLRKITSHLIENDTNTVETISSLMSEAVFEGCMPFGSHLHMEFDNGIRSSSSFIEHTNIAAI
ncbi:hypothetical protein A0J61_03912 [Choanephora cucurbitarum]|uniref:Uncharacterized protein n=1 Tax=Choanephora cucurbitarum TaxID=101091 RepID=A0A1C7NFX7_9FUNG|nr:hypothetical protein A0J61_03912 [Choanephora cucurbitarum]